MLRDWYEHEAPSLWAGPHREMGRRQVCKWLDGTELAHLPEINNQPKEKHRDAVSESSRKKHQGPSLFKKWGLEVRRLELPTDPTLSTETSLSF